MSSSMKSKTTWSDLDEIFKRHSSFLISSHLSLDGDSVGSQLAMYWYLQSLGKRCVMYNQDPVPRRFHRLTNADVITTGKPEGMFDVLLVLDASNLDRLGWKNCKACAGFSANIDHHRDNTRFADFNIVDDRAAATATIIYRLFAEGAVDYPLHVAESLYTGIMTDTGGFRFNNTTATVLSMCAQLAERGVNVSDMYQRAYDTHSPAGLLLRARIWSTLRYDLEGRVCSVDFPLQMVGELGAAKGDSEGMADITVLAEGVEVGMLIKHGGNQTHFSLRSRGSVDVGRIAQKVAGGGGHGSAAGCTIELPFEPARQQMLSIIRSELG